MTSESTSKLPIRTDSLRSRGRGCGPIAVLWNPALTGMTMTTFTPLLLLSMTVSQTCAASC
jgi:hypothetical protein